MLRPRRWAINFSENAGSPLDHFDNRRLFQPRDDGIRQCLDGRDPQRLPGQAAFAEKIVRSEDRDDRFLALRGDDGELHLALLKVKNRVRRVALRKNDLVLAIFSDLAAVADLGEKHFGIE